MKILYVISCNGGGKGGHNHSLDHVSQAIAERAEVKIVSIGTTESPVLKQSKYYHAGFKFKWWGFLKLQEDFKNLFKKFDPDVIHCFDGGAALMLMTLPVIRKKTLIYTKCGGPNERKSVAQVFGDVILFSKENLMSYNGNPRFKNTDLHLIPNRIHKVEFWKEADRKYKKDKNVFNFVRIARIGKTYEKSISQAIQLISLLHKSYKVKLTIVGTIEDKEIYDGLIQIVQQKCLPVDFITDHYTEKASRMLYIADAVIGTGRGVMEALSLGLPTFVPVADGELPVLLDTNSFDKLLSTNFSQRGAVAKEISSKTEKVTSQLVSDKIFYKNISDFSLKMATKNFALNEEVKDQYLNIYTNAILKTKKSYVLENILPLAYYINAYRKSQT